MKYFLSVAVASVLATLPVNAQTTSPSQSGSTSRPAEGQSATANPQADFVQNAQLASGANSFTEGEARARFERNGLANVTDLKKDDQGIWRAKATREGKSVSVGLDFKGNIAAQ